MKLLILFIVLNIVNVILQTVKSIATVKCGRIVAALVNAIAYGLYTVVIIYTNCELNLWAKVAVVAGANLVGVYVVKYFEEKSRKEKLWKIEYTIAAEYIDDARAMLTAADIPYNYFQVSPKYIVFNTYCATSKQSAAVKELVNKFGAKYFVSETKAP